MQSLLLKSLVIHENINYYVRRSSFHYYVLWSNEFEIVAIWRETDRGVIYWYVFSCEINCSQGRVIYMCGIGLYLTVTRFAHTRYFISLFTFFFSYSGHSSLYILESLSCKFGSYVNANHKWNFPRKALLRHFYKILHKIKMFLKRYSKRTLWQPDKYITIFKHSDHNVLMVLNEDIMI